MKKEINYNEEIKILKDKIAFVEADLERTNSEGVGGERKRITLIDYIAYMKDELRMLEDENRSRKGTR